MKSAAATKLSWSVPRWAYVARLWRGFRITLLQPRSVARVVIGSAVLTILLVGAVKWALPQVVIPKLWSVALALPAIYVALALQHALLTLLPPRAIIDSEKFVLSHGEVTVVIKHPCVTATYLTFHPQDRVLLRICYTGRNGSYRVKTVGVPPQVDFELLAKLLPVPPKIRDARQRPLRRGNHETQRQ